jgi:hypothetical protein
MTVLRFMTPLRIDDGAARHDCVIPSLQPLSGEVIQSSEATC